jgi:hypothetical protein
MFISKILPKSPSHREVQTDDEIQLINIDPPTPVVAAGVDGDSQVTANSRRTTTIRQILPIFDNLQKTGFKLDNCPDTPMSSTSSMPSPLSTQASLNNNIIRQSPLPLSNSFKIVNNNNNNNHISKDNTSVIILKNSDLNQIVKPVQAIQIDPKPKTNEPPTVLRISNPIINKLITNHISRDRNTIRSILELHPVENLKINEMVLPSTSSKPAFVKIQPQCQTSSSNLMRPSPLNNTQASLKMGPHESFAFDIGLTLAQNYVNGPVDLTPTLKKCPECDFKCDSILVLDTHFADSLHFNTGKKCFYCPWLEAFATHEQYRQHLRQEHNRTCSRSLLEYHQPFNPKHACNYCDFECFGKKSWSKKMEDHRNVDCLFSKSQINGSKRKLIENLQAPSYFDCLSNAFLFNKSKLDSTETRLTDKYGAFKFYATFGSEG